MKVVPTILILLFSGVSFGFHSFSEHLAGLELADVCLTETTIQSKNGISVCSQLVPVVTNKGTENEYTSWVCKKYEIQKIVLPRTIQKHICVGMKRSGNAEDGTTIINCTRYKVEQSHLPKTIPIRQEIINGDYNQMVWSEHIFPDCSK